MDSNEEDEKLDKVRHARMTIEEKIRREKRAKIMDDIRKPIILTPGSKEAGMRRRSGSSHSPM